MEALIAAIVLWFSGLLTTWLTALLGDLFPPAMM